MYKDFFNNTINSPKHVRFLSRDNLLCLLCAAVLSICLSG